MEDGAWGDSAVVIGIAKTPRCYDLQTETGILRRNRKHPVRIPRDKRSTDKLTEQCTRSPDFESPFDTIKESSCNAETPIETIPAQPVQNRINDERSEGIQTSIPPD